MDLLEYAGVEAPEQEHLIEVRAEGRAPEEVGLAKPVRLRLDQLQHGIGLLGVIDLPLDEAVSNHHALREAWRALDRAALDVDGEWPRARLLAVERVLAGALAGLHVVAFGGGSGVGLEVPLALAEVDEEAPDLFRYGVV